MRWSCSMSLLRRSGWERPSRSRRVLARSSCWRRKSRARTFPFSSASAASRSFLSFCLRACSCRRRACASRSCSEILCPPPPPPPELWLSLWLWFSPWLSLFSLFARVSVTVLSTVEASMTESERATDTSEETSELFFSSVFSLTSRFSLPFAVPLFVFLCSHPEPSAAFSFFSLCFFVGAFWRMGTKGAVFPFLSPPPPFPPPLAVVAVPRKRSGISFCIIFTMPSSTAKSWIPFRWQ
mmetsp:Transcript_15497/g.60613  ORF Transcript_15497/g.60613 Transcript_15497/m.60613 type:complete len:239 (+) Transcript_15497:72-788(+)